MVMTTVAARLKTLSEGSEIIFPVTHSDAVQVGDNMTLTDTLAPVQQGFGVYVISLKKWGITVGLPSKPYKRIDYLKADANIKGINDALQYAKDMGFTTAILPRNDYSFCFPRELDMQEGVTFNANGSRIKVIYNSEEKSPFNYSPSSIKPYEHTGRSIIFRKGIRNSHLVNLILEGDKYDRSFIENAEKSNEWSTGVTITESASFNSIRHCKISGFMGDNITIVSGSLMDMGINGTPLGDFDASGVVIPSTNSVVTGKTTIPSGVTTVSLANLGFSYLTGLNTKEVDFLFYTADDVLVGKYSKIKVFTTVTIPANAKIVRLKFYDENVANKDTMTVYKFGGLPMYNRIEYNEIFFGFRGGIQPGGSYNSIEHNIIRNNGIDEYQNFIDGKPSFSDFSTRYQINQEDSYGDHTVVKNNLMYGGHHGILIRTWYALVEENFYYNLSGQCVVLYPVEFTKISKNYFHTSAGSVGMVGSGHKHSHVQIDGNTFLNSALNISNATYRTSVLNNHFVDCRLTLGKSMFKDNYYKVTKNFKEFDSNYLSGDEIDANNFYTDGTAGLQLYLEVKKVKNCKFEDMIVLPYVQNGDYLTKFDDCTLNNSEVNSKANIADKTRKAILKRCELEDSTIKGGYSSSTTAKGMVTLDDCDVNLITKLNMIYSQSNAITGAHLYKIINSRISISSPLINFVGLSSTGAINQFELQLKNVEIKYTGLNPLNANFFQTEGSVKSAVFANVTLENIAFTPLTTNAKYTMYDPDTQAIQEPSTGYYPAGKFIPHGLPVSGGFMGWSVITGGYATNTAWTAATAYSLGARVFSSGNVYQCVVAGTTGTAAPTHTNGAIADGTVSWQYMSARATFKMAGTIT